MRRLSFRNSDANARALFLCPAPIPAPNTHRKGRASRRGRVAGSAHRIGSALPMFTLAGVVVYWASLIPPVHERGTMASAELPASLRWQAVSAPLRLSTITRRIAAPGATAFAAACGRDLPSAISALLRFPR